MDVTPDATDCLHTQGARGGQSGLTDVAGNTGDNTDTGVIDTNDVGAQSDESDSEPPTTHLTIDNVMQEVDIGTDCWTVEDSPGISADMVGIPTQMTALQTFVQER